MMRKVGLLISLLLIIVSMAKAQVQEVKFTQFFNFPLYIQPASTGNFKESYRISGIYRKQWNSIESEFETYGLSTDFKFSKGFLPGDEWGAGLYAIDDHLGNGLMQNQELGLSFAYHHPLDFQGRHRLSLGINFSYSMASFDIDKLLFESQFDGFVANLDLPNGEPIAGDNMANYDAGAGLDYSFLINKKWSAGVSASWLNMVKPQQSFYSDSLSEAHMNRKLISGNVKYKFNEKVALVPRWLVSLQQNETEVSTGAVLEYLLVPQKQVQLDVGAFAQWSEYIIVYAGGTYKGFSLHASYDFSISGLKEITQVQDTDFSNPGVFEISLIYKGRTKNNTSNYTVPCRIF
ncbi:PorP/SprF family type IX secretion system membrane protein [Fulvivirga ligni]|uniref:PorP/SprF family type IX secretion system membrane protein n=1 Tax=Fulvivirga ligni TaxID=2904246 RepID=UPI001F278611|nr:PorP/SprF family type IX secretion system membrane protein [Fulvivirga ligni]UII20007.1 PorP/SprF family type IX secretion system membrane protein [Fulvivirga ligni]